jgi:hypothetical protein
MVSGASPAFRADATIPGSTESGPGLDQLVRRGYVIVRGVLAPGEIVRLRAVCARWFGTYRRADMLPSEFLGEPELARVPFSPPVVDALQQLLGSDYTTFPDFNVQSNKYGGWHRDNNSEGPADYLYAPDYLFVKCGVFLQDNDAERGGGIDVVPGGHRLRIGRAQSLLSRTLRWAYYKLSRPLTVPVRAGDLVCFDSRLYHQSTWPRQVPERLRERDTVVLDTEPADAKYVLYWDASRTNAHVASFVANGVRRSQDEAFHADVWSHQFPYGFPEAVVRTVRARGLRVASAPAMS